MSELFYPHVFFEISDVCNALCPWCERGSRNRKNRSPIKNLSERGNKFIPLDEFTKRIDFLLHKGLIREKQSHINLYNWGEPLLHPQFYEIVKSLRDRNLYCELSTNGSILLQNKAPLDHVKCVYFSMPGFSQKSYDKMHGFSFDKVRATIIRSVKNAVQAGCIPTNMRIYAHRYKYNEKEIEQVENFAKKIGVTFHTSDAHFNCFEYVKKYIQGSLPEAVLQQAKNDLLLTDQECYVKPETLSMSKNMCTQFEYLTLSHRGRLSVCCAVDLTSEAYELLDFNDFPDITYAKINEYRKEHPFCITCRMLGINRTA